MSKKPSKNLTIRNSTAEFLICANQAGENGTEVCYQDETIWLTQKLMAELFDVSIPTINEHLKNIFESGELQPDSVIRKFRITAADGKNYSTQFYNLDAIISVGYRVNSKRATQFRQWATHILREFAIKGYVLDKERLENGAFLGEDYFERLLEEIREIRLGERRFYQNRADRLVQLLQSWIDEGDEEEQRETLEYLIHALDEDRLSNRKLFPRELKGKSW